VIESGWSEESVYGMSLEAFRETYQSVKRRQVRKSRELQRVIGLAQAGDKKAYMKWNEDKDLWMPAEEKVNDSIRKANSDELLQSNQDR
jgi:hypothetical protein